MKRILIFILILVLGAGLLSGCTGPETTVPQDADGTPGVEKTTEAPTEPVTEDLYLPVDPTADAPTVAAEENDPDSLLYLFRRVLAFRKKHEELHADGAITPVCAEKGKYPFVFRRDRFLICVNPTLTPREAELNAELKGTLALLVEGKPGKNMPTVSFSDGKVTLGPQALAVFELK